MCCSWCYNLHLTTARHWCSLTWLHCYWECCVVLPTVVVDAWMLCTLQLHGRSHVHSTLTCCEWMCRWVYVDVDDNLHLCQCIYRHHRQCMQISVYVCLWSTFYSLFCPGSPGRHQSFGYYMETHSKPHNGVKVVCPASLTVCRTSTVTVNYNLEAIKDFRYNIIQGWGETKAECLHSGASDPLPTAYNMSWGYWG